MPDTNDTACFTASGRLRLIAAFGGSWNGTDHNAFLDLKPELTWEGACELGFKQPDGSLFLGYLVYDNIEDRIDQVISTDSEVVAAHEAASRCENLEEIANEYRDEKSEDAFQYAEVAVTEEEFEAARREAMARIYRYDQSTLIDALNMADTDDGTRRAIVAWALDEDREPCNKMRDALAYTVSTGRCAIGQTDIQAWREATA